MSGPKLYRIPDCCSAADCTLDPYGFVIDDGEPTMVLCESHWNAVLNPIVTFDEAKGIGLVVE